MRKSDRYREVLRGLADWDEFLLRESSLPGPRANLELVGSVADVGSEDLFLRYLTYTADKAPTNSPHEFLALCGVVGLGRLVAEGRTDLVSELRKHASDSRWRTREGVAIALQRWGAVDMDALLDEMEKWGAGDLLEQRAAAAGLCEPGLLGPEEHVRRVLGVLDTITVSVSEVADSKSDEFVALRKGLAYCWSVAVVALPEVGQPLMEKWMVGGDRDVIWVMKQKLRKNRLARVDPECVDSWKARLGIVPRSS